MRSDGNRFGDQLISLSFITCAPIYKNLFTDDKEMIIPVILPFIDPETEHGFYINLISQLITSTFGAIGVPAIEVGTCIMKNTISTSAAIIENSLIEFKNGLESNGNFTDARTCQFRNIIMKIFDFNRFDFFLFFFLDALKVATNKFSTILKFFRVSKFKWFVDMWLAHPTFITGNFFCSHYF